MLASFQPVVKGQMEGARFRCGLSESPYRYLGTVPAPPKTAAGSSAASLVPKWYSDKHCMTIIHCGSIVGIPSPEEGSESQFDR
eukprot:2482513-Rhodomonas_salina.1